MRITLSPKTTVILPGLGMYLIVVGIPLFFLAIDSISAWMSKAELFSESSLSLTLGLFVICFIGSLRCVYMTNTSLSYWSIAARSFRVRLNDIRHIDAGVALEYRRGYMGIAQPVTRLFIHSGKPIVTRRMSTDYFNKSDMAFMLKKIVEHAPHVVLNGDAQLLSEGDDTKLRKIVTSAQWGALRQGVIIFFVAMVLLGVILLI